MRELKARCDALSREKQKLLDERAQSEISHYSGTRRACHQDERIAQLESELSACESATVVRVASAVAAVEKTAAITREHLRRTLATLESDNASLRAQVERFASLAHTRAQWECETTHLRAKVEAVLAARATKEQDMERRCAELRARTKQECDAALDAERKVAEEECDARLDARSKRIAAENTTCAILLRAILRFARFSLPVSS